MLNKLSISECIEKLKKKEITATELTNAYLKEIDNRDNEINAYIKVTKDLALEKAEEIDKKREKEVLKPLAGIPGGIKDNICTKEVNTTCASKMLKDFVPTYNATVIDRLMDNDFVMLGKLNMDEFAIGGGGEYSYYGPARNPLNPKYVAGGSSSGSAASVAAYECAFSLGTDTGGSVLKPSAYCGVVGIKPTFGTVSRYGVIGFAPSCEQTGPITRTVVDNALVLNAIAGYDKKDSASKDRGNIDFLEDINKDIKDLRIAIPKELLESDIIHQSVRKGFDQALEVFKDLGCKVDVVSMPALKNALSAYYVISCCECTSSLSRYDGVRFGYRTKEYSNMDELYKKTRREGFGHEVKRRIIFGTYVLTEKEKNYLDQAQKVRTLIALEYNNTFKNHDILLTPASPKTAPLIGEKPGDPADKYRDDIFTVPINLAGVPALSVPTFKDFRGLPMGMILTGKLHDEKTLYRAGHAFEKTRGTLQ